MKKFLSKIMFTAVAVLSAAGFTSCNNADDPYVPEQVTVQEQAKEEKVPAYIALLSDDLLNMYDFKLILHSGDQTKEVELTKANGEVQEYSNSGLNHKCYTYFFSDVNGRKGINYVEAKVTPKAGIKAMLESMPADEYIQMEHGASLFKATFDAKGNRIDKVDRPLGTVANRCTASQILGKLEDGMIAYEYNAETTATDLSCK